MQVRNLKGFSVIELMVVVTTIGLLALLAIPGIRQAANRTEATVMANDIRMFTEAIEFYSTAEGTYPAAMTYKNMPELIASYLPAIWKNGNYSWFYVNTKSLIYIHVYNLDFTAEQAIRLDSIIDDGNIATGLVRMAFESGGVNVYFHNSNS